MSVAVGDVEEGVKVVVEDESGGRREELAVKDLLEDRCLRLSLWLLRGDSHVIQPMEYSGGGKHLTTFGAWTHRGAVACTLVTLAFRLVSSVHRHLCSSNAYQTAQGKAKKRYVSSVVLS